MEVREIEGRRCLVGALFALDVDDDYAFDIDEPVTLSLTYATGLTTPFVVGWDRNGGEGVGVTDEFAPGPGEAFASTTLTLDRVRLAGRGVRGTDLAVSAREGIALCDVSIEQSGDTRLPTRFGSLVLEVRDGDGGPAVPARVGLYDATGRARTGDRKGGEHLQAVVARDALTVVRSRRQDCLPESDEDDPLLRRAGAPQAPVHRSRVMRRSNRGAGLARDAAVTLADGETIHNAFFDRGFRRDSS